MTKIVQRKGRLSRRLGVNLWGRAKDPVTTKNYPPGQHGATGQKKQSDFGIQLLAKQKLRGYYNIAEKQFRSIYKEAARRKGDTGENLVGLLESRLDAVVYRSNFAPTIFSAKQLISHGHITVDGKKVTISSYRLKPGQVVEVREKSRDMALIQEAMKGEEKSVPEYLDVSNGKASATYSRIPVLTDIPYPVIMEPNLVVEYYSR